MAVPEGYTVVSNDDSGVLYKGPNGIRKYAHELEEVAEADIEEPDSEDVEEEE